ncbi:5701_t:CDS:2, partial [Entrophospora sp. SA101]
PSQNELAEKYLKIREEVYTKKAEDSIVDLKESRKRIKKSIEENERILSQQIKPTRKKKPIGGKAIQANNSRSITKISVIEFEAGYPKKEYKKYIEPFPIPYVKPIPKYTLWTPILKNLKALILLLE